MEAFHSMSAAPLKDCPECGKPSLKKQIGTGAGLIFKGSGFYQTDYRSDSYQKGAKADSDSSKPKTEAASKPAEPAKPAATKSEA
jgi:putative FmdB family regulatory protein